MNMMNTEDQILNLPPQAIEAEQSILGSLMQNNKSIDDVRMTVGASDFYRMDHGLIYQSILDMFDAGEVADILTVNERLLESNQSDSYGGLSYLGNLAKNTPNTGNVKSYAKIVREKAVLRRVIDKSNEAIQLAYNPEGQSVSDIVNGVCKDFSDLSPQKYSNKNKDVCQVLKSALSTLEDKRERGEKLVGWSTGLSDVDDKTNGLQAGKLIVIGGRPSQGKTTLAMNFCESICNAGGVVQVFSLEMEHHEIGSKLLASQGGINYGHINQPSKMENDDWPRMTRTTTRIIEKWKMMVDESSGVTIDQIRMTCRETKRRYGQIDAVMIDYLQLMKLPKADRHDISIGIVTAALKGLAKELGVPVILLSQLNRGVESRPNKRPVMSDLKDASSIEQDADIIMFVYRDDWYNPDSDQKGIAEIGFGKNRAAAKGMSRVIFRGELQRFEDAPTTYNQHKGA